MMAAGTVTTDSFQKSNLGSRLPTAAALAALLCLWSAGAMAACTMENIDACTQTDPLSARLVLTTELAANRSPEMLARMALFLRTAPAPYGDPAQAAWYYQRAANAGDGLAAITLAEMTRNGEGVRASSERALELLVRATNLRPKAPAFRALGEQYLAMGERAKALDAIGQAAALGDAQARKMLAALPADETIATGGDGAQTAAVVETDKPAQVPPAAAKSKPVEQIAAVPAAAPDQKTVAADVPTAPTDSGQTVAEVVIPITEPGEIQTIAAADVQEIAPETVADALPPAPRTIPAPVETDVVMIPMTEPAEPATIGKAAAASPAAVSAPVEAPLVDSEVAMASPTETVEADATVAATDAALAAVDAPGLAMTPMTEPEAVTADPAVVAADAVETAYPCEIGKNCIRNSSFAADGVESGDAPSFWSTNNFGGNAANFYLAAGRTDATAAVVDSTSESASTDAKWVINPIPVSGGQYFKFSNWYKSAEPTEIYAYFTGGSVGYQRLARVPPSATPDTWTHVDPIGFFVPEGATGLRVAQVLTGGGRLTTDDYVLMPEQPPLFEQGLVSLTFDDAWKSVYTNAIPVLNSTRSSTYPVGLKSTQYIVTDPVILHPERYPNNMSLADVLEMQSEGHDIAGHSRTHADLVFGLTDEKSRLSEIAGSRDDLTGAGITKVSNFAYPYGRVDDTVRALVARNYAAARGVTRGFNLTTTDKYDLLTYVIGNSTAADDVEGWIDEAIKGKRWLILTFHRVEPTMADCVWSDGRPDVDCVDTAMIREIAAYLAKTPAGTTVTVDEVVSKYFSDQQTTSLSPQTAGPATMQARLP